MSRRGPGPAPLRSTGLEPLLQPLQQPDERIGASLDLPVAGRRCPGVPHLRTQPFDVDRVREGDEKRGEQCTLLGVERDRIAIATHRDGTQDRELEPVRHR